MWNLCCIGLNHKTAPVEIREKIAIKNEDFLKYIFELKEKGKITGGIWLQTCNRSELYFTSEEKGDDEILDFLKGLLSLDRDYKDIFYILSDISVVDHLFNVSSSLDSMVIGEPQILGQVKDAFEFHLKNGVSNTLLNELFQASLKVGKRVRTETKIGEGAVSVPYVAVELAKKIFGEISDLKILFIGAGEMAELSLMHLKENGAKDIRISNRTYDKALKLAEKFEAKPYSFEDLKNSYKEVDLILSCTGSREPFIKYIEILEAIKLRKYKPIILIDMALPPDSEKKINEIENCFLYNIDDLKYIAEENKKGREKKILEAEKVVADEVEKFQKRWEFLKISPLIQEIKDYIYKIKEEEMEKLFKKNLEFNEKQKREIEIFVHSFIQKILHPVFIQIKEAKPKKVLYKIIKKFLGMENI